MQRFFVRVVTVIAAIIISVFQSSYAKVTPQKFGIIWDAADSLAIRQAGKVGLDSLLQAGPLKNSAPVYAIQRLRPSKNFTPDFYLLTGLCLMLGFVRYSDPRYFSLLIGAYRGTGSGRQWRDLLQAAALSNLGMNVFFCAVAGAYIYYVTPGATARLTGYHTPLVLLLLIAGMMVMYAGKYAVIRFSGRAFRVEAQAGEYLFNVFLVNKVMGIVLLPFVIVIAFAGSEWVQPMTIVSATVILILLSTRYIRSWSAFYDIFKGSGFHFITYLCASEILPMAVLVKWSLHLMN